MNNQTDDILRPGEPSSPAKKQWLMCLLTDGITDSNDGLTSLHAMATSHASWQQNAIIHILACTPFSSKVHPREVHFEMEEVDKSSVLPSGRSIYLRFTSITLSVSTIDLPRGHLGGYLWRLSAWESPKLRPLLSAGKAIHKSREDANCKAVPLWSAWRKTCEPEGVGYDLE